MDLQSFTQYIPTLSVDWIILGGLVLFFTFDNIRAGSARVTALAIALPLALLLSSSASNTAFIGAYMANAAPAVQTGIFLALAIGLFVAFYRIVDSSYDSPHIVQALMAGAAGAVITTLVLLELPDATIPISFTDPFKAIFGEAYRIYWFVGSYFLLAIARA